MFSSPGKIKKINNNKHNKTAGTAYKLHFGYGCR